MYALALKLAVLRSGGRLHAPREGVALGTASVVIPCYRYGNYLPDAVAAALDQPGLDVEVIIVDDASPDDSREIAEGLAHDDPRVRVIAHTRNQGHIQTYNDGLDAATGDWVALVSADDLVTPGSLTRAASLMVAHPSVGFVYGRARHFSGNPPAPALDDVRWITWTGAQWLAERCRAGNNVIASPEVVMRGSVARSIGGYSPALPHSGDLEMWMRAATVADVGYIVGADQALYRQHESNMHNVVFGSSQLETAAVDLAHRWSAFQAVLDGPARRLERHDQLEASARATFVGEALNKAAAARAREMPTAAEQFLELASTIGGPQPSRTLDSSRLVTRSWNRVSGSFKWWRLNRVGV